MHSIFLVEDSLEYALTVRQSLGANYEVTTVTSLNDARKQFKFFNFDLVLLDVTLPDGLGFDLLPELQARVACPPVLFLSGRTEMQDKVLGWSLGADDYITKPFSPLEFRARVQNRIDKFKAQKKQDIHLHFARVKMDLTFHEAVTEQNGMRRSLNLTPIEFKILVVLVKSVGRILSRGQLIQHAWGDSVHITERTVDKHISTLRQKLAHSGASIKTVSGIGYRLIENGPS